MFLGLGLTIHGQGGGGAPGNSPESQQFFDRLLTPPSGARETLYADLIDGLVADGVFAKLDLLAVIGVDEPTARENLVSEDYRIVRIFKTGAPMTYTSDVGWTGANGNAYLDMIYNLAAAAGLYQQNDAMVAFWTAGLANGVPHLAVRVTDGSTETDETHIWPDDFGGSVSWGVNISGLGAASASASPTNTNGFWLNQRTASNAQALYFNDMTTAFQTSTTASAAMPNRSLECQSPGTIRVMALGASLNTAQRTALKSRLETYILAVAGVTP